MGVRVISANISEETFRVTRQLDQYDSATRQRIIDSITESTKAVYTDVQTNIPRGATGNLGRGVKMDVNVRQRYVSGVVSSKAPHGHLVEFGTEPRYWYKTIAHPKGPVAMVIYRGVMPKHPFMKPAIEKERPRIESRLREAVSRV